MKNFSKEELDNMNDIELLNAVNEIKNDINKRMEKTDQFCKKVGMTHAELQEYLNTPSNFSAEEQKIINELKQHTNKLEEKLTSISKKHTINKKSTPLKKQTITRKLVAQRKNWMPVN